MRSEFLPFSRPTITEGDISAVADVLRSGWITTGPNATEFENEFCEYVGCRGSVALASATAGMHLALKALDIGPGDEVITPSMTWVSTANLIILAGATPVFADIDKDTLMVTPETITACITDKTRLIIPVHFAGAAADVDAIRGIADKAGAVIIEDAAHAIGTRAAGEHIGRNQTAVFSFHPIKNITTGEGGMLCSPDEDFLNRIKRLKFHGLGVDAHDRQTQGRSPQAEVQEPGFKYNMTDIAAVLGRRQLARVDEFNRRRADIAKQYLEQLTDIEEIIPLGRAESTTTHAWHLFIMRLDTDKAGMTRDEFMGELKSRNIGTGIHFRATHTQKYYRETMNIQQGALPNTEWNSDRICSLPLFPEMHDSDVVAVVDTIKEVLKSRH